MSVKISYCRSEVIVFLFYQELNAIQTENLALIAHFAGFRLNSVLMQNNREFKKYELQKKSIFQQLDKKISNFAGIRRNNKSIYAEEKKNCAF